MEGGGNVQGDLGEVSSSSVWRSRLLPDERQRIVSEITGTLKRHLPIKGGDEGISELNRIAVRFEEKIYTTATSLSEYLRKISMKMLTVEQKTSECQSNHSGSTINKSQGTSDPGK